MRQFLAAAAITLAALPAVASDDDIISLRAGADVPTTMDRLEAAVSGAGATVFARVDHAAGAASVAMALAPSQLLIFGNPKMGTAPMQDDPRAGLFLPLRVLVYEDAAGQVWVAYQDPREMFEDLDISDDAPYLEMMAGALAKLTAAAAE
ncbi:DUF302 domain-containing protein [Roseovarius autotrophicus]|uniref:DUF302 domain-containing protein n=1 Tax=Roseovarius autotrophicus TaxID=2824121 RepID=UPI0019F0DC05|nr:DUF302 domain-containing protein [Roseovarius autotrophicus]MBE0453349.1 DUF302 domain-containing protein [Roseovarius sp.]